jgi:hypothetical protein
MVAKIGNNGKDFASNPIGRIIDREELRDRPPFVCVKRTTASQSEVIGEILAHASLKR